MNTRRVWSRIAATAALSLLSFPGIARAAAEYESSEVMVPVRDGIKLHTLLLRPKGDERPLPILLQRTPYGVPARAQQSLIRGPLKPLADDGYLFAFQDIRGRFGSEGTFVLERPARDASDPKAVNATTDAYDTIDWLVKNVAANNGRVGMWGVSYPGWLTVQALLDPHPALRAASPQAAPGDQFLCDDEHHNGAFRLSPVFQYLAVMGRAKEFTPFDYGRRDLYDWFLDLGPLSNVNARHFHGKVSGWNDLVEHPDYDRYWRERALPARLGRPRVPTLHVIGWWDQEDFSGPLRSYETTPLERDLDLAGPITARLFASTSGTDCDWVVKLIDVFPEDDPAMGGYQLIIADEVFRARYRKAFDRPEPLTPDRVESYVIDLHHGAHRFRRGHKVMLQVQSTWFPLIDRNPQTYVPNIYRAKETDFRPATQRVFRTDHYPTAIELTVLPD